MQKTPDFNEMAKNLISNDLSSNINTKEKNMENLENISVKEEQPTVNEVVDNSLGNN